MAGSGPVRTLVDDRQYFIYPALNYAVASAAGTVTVKASPGRLCVVTVTVTGTGTLTIYDNTAASGTVLLAVPASAPVGTIYVVNLPALLGVTVSAPASSPAVTIGYS